VSSGLDPENGDPKNWALIKEALADLVDLPPEQRLVRLAAIEEQDPQLARRLRELLDRQAGADSSGFLKPVREDPGRYVPELAALATGTRVGPFTVEHVHAVGGASVVYAARQDSPARRVALKVLVPGPRREQVLARFEVEKDLLARLCHPGIAEVYGAASLEEARRSEPWIAMEWVEGGATLVEYARERDLDVPACLGLMLDVCDAVQHGHVRGVVHRDLKPANVLVDADGRVKVIDFGIARVLDGSSADTVTRHGDFLGTLAYMSPELLGGDPHGIDTRVDVYALGVVLFQLLCRRLPHDLEGESITGAVRRIQDHAPRRPSSLASGIGRDLEAVILKALAREPGRRYSNAGELGADLKRVLEARPVVARPPGAAEAAWLFLRRHRGRAAALAGLVLAVGAGVGGFLWHAVRTAQVERAERQKLERTTEFLSKLLTTVATGAGTIAPREVLAHVSETLDEELPLEARAQLHLTLGATWMELEDYERAFEHFDIAHALQISLNGPRAKWAACALDMKGEALIRAGQPAAALKCLDQAYSQYSTDPQYPAFMRGLAAHKRAKAYRDLGLFTQAEACVREALALYVDAFGPEAEATAGARETLDGILAVAE
jgi:tetratricopeptide (TPR) repeat protein